jgi:ribosomal protein S18 acetylase RimI-like enzyme
MKFTIKIADSLSEYLQHWTKAMADMHWFNASNPFGYVREEMTEEIAKEFNQPENIHLLAKSEAFGEVLGVLKVMIQGSVGTLGRWEPAVSIKHRESGVGEALIEKAFTLLRKRYCSKARCILKFPYNQPKTAHWHIGIYQKCGFVMERPSGILLLADLSKVAVKPTTIANLHIIEGSNFSLEKFADFTQRAYMSTPQDIAVHQSDPYISNRENLLKTLRAIRAGKMGSSPSECWQVARLKENIAGFIIAFILTKSKYRPLLGVIGELGVFSGFRRKGIAMFLISNIFEVFRKHGCGHSLVGTPKTNQPALKLYNKMGYTPAFEQIDFVRTL